LAGDKFPSGPKKRESFISNKTIAYFYILIFPFPVNENISQIYSSEHCGLFMFNA